MAKRKGHYMPTSLLDSQFATLEAPAADERAIVVPIRGRPEDIMAELVADLEAETGQKVPRET
jgi:gluconokinase